MPLVLTCFWRAEGLDKLNSWRWQGAGSGVSEVPRGRRGLSVHDTFTLLLGRGKGSRRGVSPYCHEP